LIVVIQCAAGKQTGAGHLHTRDGRNVLFVAHPPLAPQADTVHHARPDDPSDTHGSWRDVLVRYNAEESANSLGLLPASALYSHPTYRRLASQVDPDKLFILSAGWGLLPATYRTPNYDITFSGQAEAYKRRRRTDRYADFTAPGSDLDAPMTFFGGKSYVPLFARLTARHRGPRTVFYNSPEPPDALGCRPERFVTTTRTNWHYECADTWLRQH